MNNETCKYNKCGDNSNINYALKKIEHDSQFIPLTSCSCISPADPSGNPTEPARAIGPTEEQNQLSLMEKFLH